MKILKQGKDLSNLGPMFTCSECGCQWWAEIDEAQRYTLSDGHLKYIMDCPNCGCERWTDRLIDRPDP